MTRTRDFVNRRRARGIMLWQFGFPHPISPHRLRRGRPRNKSRVTMEDVRVFGTPTLRHASSTSLSRYSGQTDNVKFIVGTGSQAPLAPPPRPVTLSSPSLGKFMRHHLLPLAAVVLAIAAPATAQTAPKVEEASIADLKAMIASGAASSETITQAYLARIAAMDRVGPRFVRSSPQTPMPWRRRARRTRGVRRARRSGRSTGFRCW